MTRCAPSVWKLEPDIVLFTFPMVPTPDGVRSGLFKYEMLRMRDLAMAIYPVRIELPRLCKATVTVLTEEPKLWRIMPHRHDYEKSGRQGPKVQARRELEAMVSEVFGADEVVSHVRKGRCLTYVRLCAGRPSRLIETL